MHTTSCRVSTKTGSQFNSGEKTAYHSPRSLLRSYALTSSEVWETHFQGMGKTLKSGDRDRTCLQVTRHALTVTLLWSTACVHHGRASTTRGMRDGYGVTPSCNISFICSSFLSSLYLACSQKRPTSQLLRCLFTKKKRFRRPAPPTLPPSSERDAMGGCHRLSPATSVLLCLRNKVTRVF